MRVDGVIRTEWTFDLGGLVDSWPMGCGMIDRLVTVIHKQKNFGRDVPGGPRQES